MNPLVYGVVAGLTFGAVDVCLMLPMSFPDKRTALLAAFFSRFGIGLVIALIQLRLVARMAFSVLLSGCS